MKDIVEELKRQGFKYEEIKVEMKYEKEIEKFISELEFAHKYSKK
jgi:hypothetical protein